MPATSSEPSNGLTDSKQGQVYSGDDRKDFIWVMVYTGLRIPDVGLFRMDRFRHRPRFRPRKRTKL